MRNSIPNWHQKNKKFNRNGIRKKFRSTKEKCTVGHRIKCRYTITTKAGFIPITSTLGTRRNKRPTKLHWTSHRNIKISGFGRNNQTGQLHMNANLRKRCFYNMIAVTTNRLKHVMWKHKASMLQIKHYQTFSEFHRLWHHTSKKTQMWSWSRYPKRRAY